MAISRRSCVLRRIWQITCKRCVEFPLGLAARTTPRDPHRDRGPRQLLLLLLLLLLMLILPLPLTLGGPSEAAEPADKTRRAPHRDVRRFPRGQDAPSENPAGFADPTRSVGREGGVCFLCARFLCTSKERWLAPSRRESS